MNKRTWEKKIQKACEEAGIYKPFFDSAISALAGILEKRDKAEEILDDENTELVIEQTNKSGFTNMVKNPAYCMWEEMNKTALAYWKDLGLTPAGLKKLNEEVFTKEKVEKSGNSLKLLLMEKKASNG